MVEAGDAPPNSVVEADDAPPNSVIEADDAPPNGAVETDDAPPNIVVEDDDVPLPNDVVAEEDDENNGDVELAALKMEEAAVDGAETAVEVEPKSDEPELKLYDGTEEVDREDPELNEEVVGAEKREVEEEKEKGLGEEAAELGFVVVVEKAEEDPNPNAGVDDPNPNREEEEFDEVENGD